MFLKEVFLETADHIYELAVPAEVDSQMKSIPIRRPFWLDGLTIAHVQGNFQALEPFPTIATGRPDYRFLFLPVFSFFILQLATGLEKHEFPEQNGRDETVDPFFLADMLLFSLKEAGFINHDIVLNTNKYFRAQCALPGFFVDLSEFLNIFCKKDMVKTMLWDNVFFVLRGDFLINHPCISLPYCKNKKSFFVLKKHDKKSESELKNILIFLFFLYTSKFSINFQEEAPSDFLMRSRVFCNIGNPTVPCKKINLFLKTGYLENINEKLFFIYMAKMISFLFFSELFLKKNHNLSSSNELEKLIVKTFFINCGFLRDVSEEVINIFYAQFQNFREFFLNLMGGDFSSNICKKFQINNKSIDHYFKDLLQKKEKLSNSFEDFLSLVINLNKIDFSNISISFISNDKNIETIVDFFMKVFIHVFENHFAKEFSIDDLRKFSSMEAIFWKEKFCVITKLIIFYITCINNIFFKYLIPYLNNVTPIDPYPVSVSMSKIVAKVETSVPRYLKNAERAMTFRLTAKKSYLSAKIYFISSLMNEIYDMCATKDFSIVQTQEKIPVVKQPVKINFLRVLEGIFPCSSNLDEVVQQQEEMDFFATYAGLTCLHQDYQGGIALEQPWVQFKIEDTSDCYRIFSALKNQKKSIIICRLVNDEGHLRKIAIVATQRTRRFFDHLQDLRFDVSTGKFFICEKRISLPHISSQDTLKTQENQIILKTKIDIILENHLFLSQSINRFIPRDIELEKVLFVPTDEEIENTECLFWFVQDGTSLLFSCLFLDCVRKIQDVCAQKEILDAYFKERFASPRGERGIKILVKSEFDYEIKAHPTPHRIMGHKLPLRWPIPYPGDSSRLVREIVVFHKYMKK